MIRNKIKYQISFVMAFLLCVSCKKEKNEIDLTQSHILFAKSTELYLNYIDSLTNANDSATYNNILDNFDKNLTSLNYQFPPDTDLLLTQEENDSLIKLAKRFSEIRKNKVFKTIEFEEPDTINK